MPSDEPPAFDPSDPYSVEFLRWVRDRIVAAVAANIRELNQKTYTAFCRRMQNSVARLTPTPAKK